MHASRYRWIAGYILLAALAGCASTQLTEQHVAFDAFPQPPVLRSDDGIASFYSNRFHGRKTACGERYDKTEFTAAHRTFPFGTYLRVTSHETGSSVIVRVNDRGPTKRSRLIDLSRAAADQLGMLRSGIVRVTVDVLEWGS